MQDCRQRLTAALCSVFTQCLSPKQLPLLSLNFPAQHLLPPPPPHTHTQMHAQGSPTPQQQRSTETYRHALAVTAVRPASDGTPFLYTLNLSCPEVGGGAS
jgi:hypothetical protein